MWTGGRTPLGYAVENHKLVVVPGDAATVVQLYRRYLELGSVRELKAALDAEGIVSKPRTFSTGTQAGGTPYSRGALYALPSNPTYLGQVRHKDAVCPGQHEAIVPADLHAAVQSRLAEGNNGGPGQGRVQVEPSLLAGKLFDHAGERLVPSHARKGERRYRYYVSASLLRAAASRAAVAPSSTSAEPPANTHSASPTKPGAEGWRLPAREIEQAVCAAATSILQQPSALVPDMLTAGVPPDRIQEAIEHLASLAAAQMPSGADQTIWPDDLIRMVKRIELSPDGMMLTIDTGIATTTDTDAAGTSSATDQADDTAPAHDASTTFIVSRFMPHRAQRRGMEMRLVIDGPGAPSRDDAALPKVVARAHCWFEDIVEGRAASVHALAERLGMTTRYVQRVLPLAMMAPALVEQIAAGQHPAALTVDRLTDRGPLPIRWSQQVAQLGD